MDSVTFHPIRDPFDYNNPGFLPAVSQILLSYIPDTIGSYIEYGLSNFIPRSILIYLSSHRGYFSIFSDPIPNYTLISTQILPVQF